LQSDALDSVLVLAERRPADGLPRERLAIDTRRCRPPEHLMQQYEIRFRRPRAHGPCGFSIFCLDTAGASCTDVRRLIVSRQAGHVALVAEECE
jgi:hypothetical protein